MKTSTKRIIFMLLAITFLMASVAVFSLFIKPTYARINDLRSDLASQTQTLEKYQKALGSVQELFGQLENASQVKRQVSLVFPVSKDSAYFVSQMVGLASINALTVESFSTKIPPIQPQASSIIKNIGRLAGNLKGVGSYAGIKTFLRQLERNILLIDVDELRIEGSEDPTKAFLSYQLSAVSYYQIE
jgi:Tfp pilus assembly protein PilO